MYHVPPLQIEGQRWGAGLGAGCPPTRPRPCLQPREGRWNARVLCPCSSPASCGAGLLRIVSCDRGNKGWGGLQRRQAQPTTFLSRKQGPFCRPRSPEQAECWALVVRSACLWAPVSTRRNGDPFISFFFFLYSRFLLVIYVIHISV